MYTSLVRVSMSWELIKKHDYRKRAFFVPGNDLSFKFCIEIKRLLHAVSFIMNYVNMMTSSNGNILRVTGPLWGESTGRFPS